MAEIIWTEPALADLDAIAGYIALDKPGAARQFVRRIMARVDQLAAFPESGAKPCELESTRYRQLTIPPVLLFYRVEAGRVYIVYVMRGERRFQPGNLSQRER